MKADIRHFKELTVGSVLILGRKTLNSIGIALPGRQSVVVTRGTHIKIPGVKTAHSLDDAYELAGVDKEVFVVGGGEIYEQALPDTSRIYATEVGAIIPGADTFFPSLDENWHKTDEKRYPADSDNKYPYNFVTYERQE